MNSDQANVDVAVSVINGFETDQVFGLITEIVSSDGMKVLEIQTGQQTIKPGKTEIIKMPGAINQPQLWNTDHPGLYKAVTSIVQNGKTVDQCTTTFGVRSIKFDQEKGFFLNGENMKIKGVCLHHDGGLVGCSCPERSLETKAANAQKWWL